MGLLERLLKDHEELRRRIAGMTDLVRRDASCGAEPVDPAVAGRLAEMEGLLARELEAHEALEERFMKETLRETGAEGAALVRAIKLDHESIHEVFRILDALTCLREGVSAYSLRFAVSSLAHNLERHLDYEEKSVFPLMRRLLSAARLEAGGRR